MSRALRYGVATSTRPLQCTLSQLIAETDRLRLRLFTTDDAPFILRLLNDEGWLRYIGDRQVRTLDDARRYLQQGPITMYERHGLGLWMVERSLDDMPIGMCGLIRRDGLDDVDIGFAFLPEFRSQGYAREAAAATLVHAKRRLNLPRVVAIASLDNAPSRRLLEHLGLRFEREITMPTSTEPLAFYSIDWAAPDEAAQQIDALTTAFFRLFSPNAERRIDLSAIGELFIPQGLIVKTCGQDYETYTLEQFIAPRQALLDGGRLVDFLEHEVSQRTQVMGQVAQRLSLYRKSGCLDGARFEARGVKTFQFVKSPQGWRISALAWDDERAGLALPPALEGLQASA